MTRGDRLTSPDDFRRVRRGGRSFAHPLVVLLVRPNGLPRSRWGVTTDRAVAGAVRRNRAKRRTREILRRISPRLQPGWDVVVIARPQAVVAEFSRLDGALAGLFERGGLLEGPKGLKD
jgi:ribonuclease P protein component